MVVLVLMAVGTVSVFSASAVVGRQPSLERFYEFPALRQILFFPLAYNTWFNDKKNKWWFYLIILMGLFVIIFSYSMTGYLALIIGCIVYGMFYINKIKLFFIYIGLFIVVVFGVSNVNNATLTYELKRINKYFNYLNVDETAKIKRLGTVDSRLEMWRTSQYAIKLHPLFGIGAANQPEFFKKHITFYYFGSVPGTCN